MDDEKLDYEAILQLLRDNEPSANVPSPVRREIAMAVVLPHLLQYWHDFCEFMLNRIPPPQTDEEVEEIDQVAYQVIGHPDRRELPPAYLTFAELWVRLNHEDTEVGSVPFPTDPVVQALIVRTITNLSHTEETFRWWYITVIAKLRPFYMSVYLVQRTSHVSLLPTAVCMNYVPPDRETLWELGRWMSMALNGIEETTQQLATPMILHEVSLVLQEANPMPSLPLLRYDTILALAWFKQDPYISANAKTFYASRNLRFIAQTFATIYPIIPTRGMYVRNMEAVERGDRMPHLLIEVRELDNGQVDDAWVAETFGTRVRWMTRRDRIQIFFSPEMAQEIDLSLRL